MTTANQIEIVKIPTVIKVWRRSRNKYNGVVTDYAVVDYLRTLAIERRKVIVSINGMDVEVRLLYKLINGKPYILFFLPKSLNPTWEKLNEKGEVRALITIVDEAIATNVR
jgi:hypothetical protein